jgi:hypothetical protein
MAHQVQDSMTDERNRALLAQIQRHNDEIAEAATRRVLFAWEAALLARGAPAIADDAPPAEVKRLATPERIAEMVVNGFKRLGPVVGLSVLTDEPGLIVDDMAWLQRAFTSRGMLPGMPGWEAQLLKAYAAACCEVLPDEDCAPIRRALDHAIVALAPA